jgi:hypothetical protein
MVRADGERERADDGAGVAGLDQLESQLLAGRLYTVLEITEWAGHLGPIVRGGAMAAWPSRCGV